MAGRLIPLAGAALLLLPLPSQAAPSGTGIGPGDVRSADVFELVTTFGGKAAPSLGSSREWYSPGSGRFRVERSVGRERLLVVYDGSSITRRTSAGVFRIEGERAMVRTIAERRFILEQPGITVVDQYLKRTSGLAVNRRENGRVFDADWHWVDEGIDTHVQINVAVRSRTSAANAIRHGLFARPPGKLAGILKQSKPGTRPHFGERGFWFGPTLGAAKAATLLERWGGDPFTTSMGRTGAADYQTVYRLPRSALGFDVRPGDYPGIGQKSPLDIWVTCRPVPEGPLPGVLAGTPGRRITLRSGLPATLYVEEYEQYNRSGVTADIVVGKTVCLVSGLIARAEFERLAPTLRPV